MSEKIKSHETRVGILPIIGGALIAIVNQNAEPKIAEIKPPKEIAWLQRLKMKRIQRSGKR